MIQYGIFISYIFFYIRELTESNTMSALEKVAWYFFLALTFQRTVPCFIPLKKFAWRCQRVPVVARQKGE
jgi:hypothetical protein